MIVLSGIALLIAAASGWCVVGVLWPGVGCVFQRMARTALAVALGLSLHSVADFLRLLVAPGVPLGFVAVDLTVFAGALTLWLGARRKRRRASHPTRATPSVSMVERIVIIATLAIGVWMVLGVVGWLRVAPWGEWDAWAMWNYKARVIALGGAEWTHALAPPSPHPDYPLHQPITIARLWRYGVGETALVPQAHAALVASLTFLWLVGLVGAARGTAAGCIAGALLASNPFIARHAGSQYADVTVGLYMVMSLGLIYRAMAAPDRASPAGGGASAAGPRAGAWLLAGLALGGAAWTKHEGQFFAAWAIVIVAAAQGSGFGPRIARRQVGLLIAGALPGLVCAVLVHGLSSWYEPVSSLPGGIAAETRQVWAGAADSILDPARHRMIQNAVIHLTDVSVDRILWGLVLGYAVCVGVVRAGGGGRCLRAIGLLPPAMIVGYYGAYLLTPSPLGWHLQTSADRLATQLWPCAILVLTLALRGPTESDADAERPR